jgi:hypothetical protein
MTIVAHYRGTTPMQISRSAVFVWSANLAGAGLLSYCVSDMLSRPIPAEWIVLLVLTGWISDLDHAIDGFLMCRAVAFLQRNQLRAE